MPIALKFLTIAALALCAGPMAPTVLAASRTPAEATAHALDELANCVAQGPRSGGDYCPTATPTPTVMPSPTSTSTPRPETHDTTSWVLTVTVIPTPEPCWLQDEDLGDPANGWIVFDDQGAPVPCPTDTPAEETPIEPTDTPTATPPAPQAQPLRIGAPAVGAPMQQVVVIQTVIVTAEPVATATPRPTPSPTSSPTPTATLTRTPTATATATPTVVSVAGVKATSGPVATVSRVTEPAPGRWDWGLFLKIAAAVVLVGGLVVLLVTRRRVAVWRPRKEATHS